MSGKHEVEAAHEYSVCILCCWQGVCDKTDAFTVCSSSGTDRVDFKFYDLLEQILDKQPSTSSTVVTDSIEISEDSNGESVPETGKRHLSLPIVVTVMRFYIVDIDRQCLKLV